MKKEELLFNLLWNAFVFLIVVVIWSKIEDRRQMRRLVRDAHEIINGGCSCRTEE